MILGLTGSFGSGKSTVSEMLKSSGGAHVIDTDQIAHELQQPGNKGFTAIVATFGPNVVGNDGNLDRKKIAAIVFNDAEQLKTLNAIMHPLVFEAAAAKMEMLAGSALVVFMVPLLFETGSDSLCDAVAVVSVSEEERLRRLAIRNGYSAAEVKKRLAAQMPQKEKEDRANFVINNSGSPAETAMQVESMLQQLGLATQQTQ